MTLAVLAALGPFLAKSFNIDDPLFLWTARQIQAHPANPYGFDLNWYGYESPMWEVTKNPPLACYFLAAAAAILGWGEMALHFAFLLPAVAAILGTFRLARRLCQRPLLAARRGGDSGNLSVGSSLVSEANSCCIRHTRHACVFGFRYQCDVRHIDAGVLGVGYRIVD